MLRNWESHLLRWIRPIDLLGIFPLLGLQSHGDRYIFSSVYLLLPSGTLDICVERTQRGSKPLIRTDFVRYKAICDMKYMFVGLLACYKSQDKHRAVIAVFLLSTLYIPIFDI